MVKLNCTCYPNGDFYITTRSYKAVGSTQPRRKEYHFSISERQEQNEWIHIATYSDKDFLRLIADICNTLVEYQEVADKIDADKQKTRNKPPL